MQSQKNCPSGALSYSCERREGVTFVSCAFLLFWGKEAFFMEALNLSVVPYV
ncbi:hypothetical protein [uncultured Selenomonas sp.]|uniref:hypothetical protein n=1 Tax=uncultured Selenomonas sp. TaxID=159275 RepID=UPI0026088FC5|nr:hypothetical protein [uncultured Selenomonas sp.]